MNSFYSKKFWQQVRREYKKGDSTFICNESDVFRQIWIEPEFRTLCWDIAQQFGPITKTGDCDEPHILFNNSHRNCRMKFLSYMVNKYDYSQTQ